MYSLKSGLIIYFWLVSENEMSQLQNGQRTNRLLVFSDQNLNSIQNGKFILVPFEQYLRPLVQPSTNMFQTQDLNRFELDIIPNAPIYAPNTIYPKLEVKE